MGISVRLSRLQRHLHSGVVHARFHNQQDNQDIYSLAEQSWAVSEAYGPWVLGEPLSDRSLNSGQVNDRAKAEVGLNDAGARVLVMC